MFSVFLVGTGSIVKKAISVLVENGVLEQNIFILTLFTTPASESNFKYFSQSPTSPHFNNPLLVLLLFNSRSGRNCRQLPEGFNPYKQLQPISPISLCHKILWYRLTPPSVLQNVKKPIIGMGKYFRTVMFLFQLFIINLNVHLQWQLQKI